MNLDKRQIKEISVIASAMVFGLSLLVLMPALPVQAVGATVVTGLVYNDTNANGAKEGGESGVAGIPVTLLNSTNSTVGSVVTNSTGGYKFTNAGLSGKIIVNETIPVGYKNTQPGGPTPGVYNATVSSGQTLVRNFGNTIKITTVSGTVYNDTDANGAQNGGEVGVAGIPVTLLNSTNSTVGSVVTNSTGGYKFSLALSGNMTVNETIPEGYTNTQPAGLTPGEYHSSVVAGQNVTFNFGNTLTLTTVSGIVYNDTNANGVQNGGESGIAGIPITLLNETNSTIGSTTTNSTGGYKFSVVLDGGMTVNETIPVGYTNTQPGGPTPGSYNSTVTAGENVTFNFGNALSSLPSTVTGTIFNDANGDGLQDNGDAGIAGARVIAVNLATPSTVLNTTTASDGSYTFNGQTNNSTVLIQVAPVPTSHLPSNGTHSFVYKKLSLGQNTINFSLLPINSTNSATINGTIFNDTNNNGIKDLGETGLNNTQVFVVDFLTLTQTTVHTNATGYYTATGILPDNVLVQAAPLPAKHLPSNGTQSFHYAIGLSQGSTTTVDFPLRPVNDSELMTINATVFNDTNSDGTKQVNESGLSGIQVFSFVLLTAEQQNKFTDNNGTATFTGVTPDVTLVQVLPGNHTATSPPVTSTSGHGFKYFVKPQVATAANLTVSFGLH